MPSIDRDGPLGPSLTILGKERQEPASHRSRLVLRVGDFVGLRAFYVLPKGLIVGTRREAGGGEQNRSLSRMGSLEPPVISGENGRVVDVTGDPAEFEILWECARWHV